jgi:hypothetical protein
VVLLGCAARQPTSAPVSIPQHHCPDSNAIRVPRGVEGDVKLPITAKFAILADGRLDGFSMLTPGVPDEIALAVKRSLEACTFTPGKDASGKSVAVWVLLPLRFHREAKGTSEAAVERVE